MKPPRPKIHILDCEDPLFAFRDLAVRCQTVLHNAEMKMSASSDMQEYLMFPMGTCLECLDAAPVGDDKRHYIYFLVEAQEEKHFQSEYEAVA